MPCTLRLLVASGLRRAMSRRSTTFLKCASSAFVPSGPNGTECSTALLRSASESSTWMKMCSERRAGMRQLTTTGGRVATCQALHTLSGRRNPLGIGLCGTEAKKEHSWGKHFWTGQPRAPRGWIFRHQRAVWSVWSFCMECHGWHCVWMSPWMTGGTDPKRRRYRRSSFSSATVFFRSLPGRTARTSSIHSSMARPIAFLLRTRTACTGAEYSLFWKTMDLREAW